MEITTEVDFEITCAECGSSLVINNEALDSKMNITLEIKPCQKCLNNAEDKGYDNGIKSA